MKETIAASDDSEPPAPEPINVTNGTVVYDDWESMMESWRTRSAELCKEMKSFGWTALFYAGCHDDMDGEQTTSIRAWNGNYFTAVGLAEEAKHWLQSRE